MFLQTVVKMRWLLVVKRLQNVWMNHHQHQPFQSLNKIVFCFLSHTTSDQNTVSVTLAEVPDEEVQEDALAVASQVEESANQCSQISTPHHPVDPLESLLNEVIKDQSEFCEPDGFLSGLSDSEDNIEVADLSQSSSDHSEVSPSAV